jgi:ribose transport system ATP-binding protein
MGEELTDRGSGTADNRSRTSRRNAGSAAGGGDTTDDTTGQPPALLLNGVSKTFGTTRALVDLDLSVRPGSVHAIIGQNGSGKSTLVKILAGYHQPDDGGRALVSGSELKLGSAEAARTAGLRFVHQDLGLIDDLSITDNFFLGEGGSTLTPLNRRSEGRLARQSLRALGYDLDPRRPVRTLAESERTAVCVARALAHSDPIPLIILDEPTASMPGDEVERLFGAVRRIAANGTAVLFISHHLNEVLALADEITVLRDGMRVATVDGSEVSHSALVELMLGRVLAAAAHRAHASLEIRSSSPALLLESVSGERIQDLSMSVEAGSIAGVVGLTGSGREDVARAIAGSIPRAGRILVEGREIPPADPGAAARAGVGYVPADRRHHAVLTGLTVRENLTISDLTPMTQWGRLSRRSENRVVQQLVAEYQVVPPSGETSVMSLSGGNQQKVMIARVLRCSPKVIVLDEPTQGVDIGAKKQIDDMIKSAASQGAAVVVCSTDAEQIAALADEVVVFRSGVVGAILRGDSISTDRIEQEQLISVPGLSAPAGAEQ